MLLLLRRIALRLLRACKSAGRPAPGIGCDAPLRGVRCGARAEVAPKNSLRSLRSLWSTVSASQSTKRAARADLGAALLAVADSPRRWPARGLAETLAPREFDPRTSRWLPARPGLGDRRVRSEAARRRAGTQTVLWTVCALRAAGLWTGAACKARARGPRAQRASCSDSLTRFDHSERSERREFGNGATRPSTAAQSLRSSDRLGEAPGGHAAAALQARSLALAGP